MRLLAPLFFSVLLLATAGFLAACNDSDSGPAPVGANLHGGWNAVYANPETGEVERFRAKVNQRANELIITTEKAFPPGQMFIGTISSNAIVEVTDQFDSETWSTFSGSALKNDFTISDFIVGPMGADDPDDFPLFAIRFTR